ncbi:uncharacterized protein PHACADRAFT_186553 [Phanerochaete carnosa HHB-10118-sp]|uniref:Uncharacterized protein n=1 Tax=Phanerochaete carnosa (strain HHB-10118-sp) TaxID=650164 RepID=K5URB8_PHACS|nr:uncharacterized protein PHACADRAFT_186553 [Phanerochaete carnosa HHB-10118-sp]EKM52406.1 hypothetical protein PHACADRAFT_186553 [Phanerochaete carnosa HHB-10118-sp]
MLLTLAASPSLFDPALADCLHSVSLAVRLPTADSPWLYHAHELRQLRNVVTIRLALAQNGTLERACANPAYAIFSSFPLVVPGVFLRVTVLSLERMRFSSTADISRLINQLGTVQSCILQDVIFEKVAALAPRARLRPTVIRHRFEVAPSGATRGATITPISFSVLTAILCPAHHLDAWSSIVSLLQHLFSQYTYEIRLIYIPEGGTSFIITLDILVFAVNNTSSDNDTTTDQQAMGTSLEAAFGPTSADDSTLIVSLSLSLPDEVISDSTGKLDWSALEDGIPGLETIPHVTVHTHRSVAPKHIQLLAAPGKIRLRRTRPTTTCEQYNVVLHLFCTLCAITHSV